MATCPLDWSNSSSDSGRCKTQRTQKFDLMGHPSPCQCRGALPCIAHGPTYPSQYHRGSQKITSTICKTFSLGCKLRLLRMTYGRRSPLVEIRTATPQRFSIRLSVLCWPPTGAALLPCGLPAAKSDFLTLPKLSLCELPTRGFQCSSQYTRACRIISVPCCEGSPSQNRATKSGQGS